MFGSSPRSTIWAAVAATAPLLLLSHLAPSATALYVTEGSPCWDVCNNPTNTTSSEIVCLDDEYNSTTTGQDFQKCVSCALESNYTASDSWLTDVDWGLYNLRFAFSSCVYGYPESVVSMSTPCLVSCLGLDTSIEFNLLDPNDININAWCATSSFANNQIDTCSVCYNLTGTQVYMANFIQALRYDCNYPVPTGTAFPISPSLIFSESALPSYSSNLLSTSKKGFDYKLATLVGLPVMGFVILVILSTMCCMCGFSWYRRMSREDEELREWKTMAAERTWEDYPPQEMYPASMYQQAQTQQQQQQQQQQAQMQMQGQQYGPGFQVVEPDGRTHEAGFSKTMVTETVTSSTGISPVEKGKGAETGTGTEQGYFPGDVKV
ncbi:hypothetical protein BO70DRAFT_360823 [Aspergillus heteromorphus CBS 117.55]|uniref:Uncharacterized protein n=1 Tax=Aspergillus heteromorphus CBS 117.55 TaxID=1448321 RepID=A0A317WL26_9EURO|nr:uncharacterized protein BO70DRAFT_360823 [Aspergillus heteromorphus CBS 117.55]PWY86012.1 hypothetical protein BO70DRAFT_360823 [Aspergillus heteromorphus CBS 117.55]